MWLSEEAQIKDFFNREVQKHFAIGTVNCKERIRVIADLYKYRDEIKYINLQKKGKIPRGYSVYFDNEFCCSFNSEYLPEAVLLEFWRGLMQLFNAGKINFDQKMYKVEEEVEKFKKIKQKEIDTTAKNKLKKKLRGEKDGELIFDTIQKLNEPAC